MQASSLNTFWHNCLAYLHGDDTTMTEDSLEDLKKQPVVFVSTDILGSFYYLLNKKLKNEIIKNNKHQKVEIFHIFMLTMQGLIITLLPKKCETNFPTAIQETVRRHTIDIRPMLVEQKSSIEVVSHQNYEKPLNTILETCMIIDWLSFSENYSWWTYEDYEDLFTNPKYSVLIATCNGKMIGYLAYCLRDDNYWCYSLARHPKWIGYNVGGKLLEELIKTANQENKKVALRVLKNNTAAIQLYQKFGFKITDSTLDEDKQDCYVMSTVS